MSQLSGKFIQNLTIALGKLSQSGATTGQVAYWGGSAWLAGYPPQVIETYVATTTLANNEQDLVIMNLSVAGNLTLPISTTRKKPLTIKTVGAGKTTVLPATGETIDSGASAILSGKNSITLIPAGGNWWIT